ncbi:protein strawberry notch-like isoform X1 [Trichogramma pretiosum]|uniref:protein strawberry notch-like isoform X1 n=1 Tax=Trichogramma pretiosum TaxID=7493 RepID=UPI0006C9A70C|nr:protein strawberry notch-like isoform X1 [Trichogramma pretiosum]XP_014237072.1 protein strawberry notch-like isoform X1 [Trichogramma pretiosum]XP_014237073.1 protein strawberry notch-like isoform X1 [Trichogramma pretiosum]
MDSSSDSDFDDDPDNIEVPGGGASLATLKQLEQVSNNYVDAPPFNIGEQQLETVNNGCVDAPPLNIGVQQLETVNDNCVNVPPLNIGVQQLETVYNNCVNAPLDVGLKQLEKVNNNCVTAPVISGNSNGIFFKNIPRTLPDNKLKITLKPVTSKVLPSIGSVGSFTGKTVNIDGKTIKLATNSKPIMLNVAGKTLTLAGKPINLGNHKLKPLGGKAIFNIVNKSSVLQPQNLPQQPQIRIQQTLNHLQTQQIRIQQPQVRIQQPQVRLQQPQIRPQQSQIRLQLPQTRPQQSQIRLQQPQARPQQAQARLPAAQATAAINPALFEEEEEEEMAVAETYAVYKPSKLNCKNRHPDPVVETSTLASVEPVDITYKLSIPERNLSSLQLESITYASQQHEHLLPDQSRAGFFIGDGAGVGKGRTIAGIIYENYLKGRKKAIWVSVSNDLRYDAERDLKDINAPIPIHVLKTFKYKKIEHQYGVIFSTYSALIGEQNQQNGYAKNRLKQLVEWCGKKFDGLIIFDECHKAKNLFPAGGGKSTKIGKAVLDLQNDLPDARVVYASATGATEPKNMAYMVRLGLWGKGTPFREFSDFITSIEKRGVGAMEIVAMDMKLRGMYIARQLSFRGVSFEIKTVELTKEFEKNYDKAVELWVDARQKFEEAFNLLDAEHNMKKTAWGQFWASHQRFFKYMCIAAKVDCAVKIALTSKTLGKCVVIGLQSTGEAKTLEQIDKDDELNDFVSSAKGVLESLVTKHFPAPNRSHINKILEKNELLNKIKSSTPKAIKRAASPIKTPKIDSPKKICLDSSEEEAELVNSDDGSDSKEDSDFNDSDDDNYFGKNSDSDDDEEFWMVIRKKKKKQKKKKKLKSKKSSNKTDVNTKPKEELSTNEYLNMITKVQRPTIQQPTKVIPPTPQPRNTSPKLQLQDTSPKVNNRDDNINRACQMKDELLKKIEQLGPALPPNTLDHLINELGGPENVAEMTGRKGRVVQSENGAIYFESRKESECSLENLNVYEKDEFMNGNKQVAIISEAASSGISLHSDNRAANKRQRVHITLELPWSADRAIQQFGRTHRSNQANAPKYIFLISDLAGERRFAATVAKRLESLGALTHGDRRATESHDLSQFNIDNKYGRRALEVTMRSIMGKEKSLVPEPKDYPNFFQEAKIGLLGVGLVTMNRFGSNVEYLLDKDYGNMSKFLNRILGLRVRLQNTLFQYFMDTLQEIILQAKRAGEFDQGILDLGGSCKRKELVRYYRRHSTGVSPAELHTLEMEKGMSWADVLNKIHHDLYTTSYDFYVSRVSSNGKCDVQLAVSTDGYDTRWPKTKKNQIIYHPSVGRKARNDSIADLEKKYRKADVQEAKKHWELLYEGSKTMCRHVYYNGSCKRPQECEVGRRLKTYHVLSGSVLSVWSQIEHVLSSQSQNNGHHHGLGGYERDSRIQVLRLQTDDEKKIVGTVVPKSRLAAMHQILQDGAVNIEREKF